MLLSEFQKSAFPELPKNMKEFHDRKFNSHRSSEIKKEWSDLVKIEWQKDEKQQFDAHHIIPKLNGGPHESWNMFPLNRSEHIKVHGKNSVLTRFQKWLTLLIDSGREN